MTKPFVYQVRFLPGTQNEYLLERVTSSGDRQGLPYEPNDSHWMALLSRQPSFRFLGRDGSLSVYLEHSRAKDPASRGDKPYWSAYRKARGVQVKTYLGQDLTTSKLEAAAARVAARIKEKVGLPDSDPLLTTRLTKGKSREQQQVRHLLDQLEKKDQMIADLKQEAVTRDQMMADLKQKLVARDQVLTDLKQKLLERDQAIARFREHSASQGKRRKPSAKRS